MKVVMVSTFPLEPNRISGGVAGVCVYLAKALSKLEGVQVEVIAVQTLVDKETIVNFDGITVHHLAFDQSVTPMQRLISGIPDAVREKLATMQFDIVHVQGLARLAQKLDYPRILTIHGIPERDVLFVKRRWNRLRSLAVGMIEGSARKQIKHIISISPYVRNLLAGQLRGKVYDIENPVADSFFDCRHEPQPGRILFGGQVIPRKNVLGLIEALARIVGKHPVAQLRIAGEWTDASYVQSCREAASRLGVAHKVHFLGNLSVDELKAELSAAACLALCSFQETAPVIIEEAMAIGVPVVASRICGIPYMVADGKTGRTVDPRNIQSIADAFCDVLDPQKGSEMSALARAAASTRFRASVVAARTLAAYEDVLRGMTSAGGKP